MKKLLTLCLFFCLGATASAQYIYIDENYTVDQLVNNVLINNPCAAASNVSVTTWNFGSGSSYGYFSANGSGFPFQNGVVLTTGRATGAIGPNTSLLSDGPTNWPGDSDLENALGVNNSVNATVLEFDFIPAASHFSFDYIFSSEQYLTNPSANQCGYTDGFAFLLQKVGSGQPYQNLAVVPGSTTPVTVNTVRGEGTICPVSNPNYFDAFNGQEHPTNYNGQTRVMTAFADVDPNELYHIKLVVADQGNNLYDSAIFLGGGSFGAKVDFGPDLLEADGLALCPAQTFLLDASEVGATNYQWFKNNVALPAETSPTYTVTDAGTYSVTFNLTPTCISTGEITIEYTTAPVINPNVSIVQCDPDGDGSTTFNLVQAIGPLTNDNPNLTTANFYTSAAPGSTPIANPTAFTASNGTTIYVLFTGTNCPVSATVTLSISNATVNPGNLLVCGSAAGTATVDFAADVTPGLLSGLPPGLTVRYYATQNDALAMTSALGNTASATAPGATFYARIVNGPDCYGIVPISVAVDVFEPSGFQDELVVICGNSPGVLVVAQGFSSYLWSNGDTDNQTTVTVAGTYSVVVENANGCTAMKQFLVTSPDAPEFESVYIYDFNNGSNSITVEYSGNGNYEFSLDGNTFQSSPTFENLPSGDYSIYIRDSGGCYRIGPFAVFVSDYPRFFTPNGDGYNDFWRPSLAPGQQGIVTIFDRYGKLVQTLDSGSAWDGKLNSRDLPSTDYWFVLEIRGGRQLKGHFSLKR